MADKKKMKFTKEEKEQIKKIMKAEEERIRRDMLEAEARNRMLDAQRSKPGYAGY